MNIISFIAKKLRYARSHLKRALPDLMPKRLFTRTLIIIAAPLVLLQSILAFVSMERHWQLVTSRLSDVAARNVSALIQIAELAPSDPENKKLATRIAQTIGFQLDFIPNTQLPPPPTRPMFDILDSIFRDAIDHTIRRPHWVDTQRADKRVEIRIKLDQHIARLFVLHKQVYASNTHIFIVWMVGSSIILLLIAVMFLRNQIRPILQLSEAAERFGKGLPPVREIHPHGALEIRQASQAFLLMRDRIERHVQQRTTMLAGVSHDLRTILTRFKLELALTSDSPEITAMRKDVDEMQDMINAYMDFAKGEGNEQTAPTDIDDLLREVRDEMARSNKSVKLQTHLNGIDLPLRRAAFKRAVTNLVANAARHATQVELSSALAEKQLLIRVDDNGPGIARDKRDEVFLPFVRLDNARTQYEGASTGLGLSIARDIIHSHGGRITLDDSPLGGLKATIKMPL